MKTIPIGKESEATLFVDIHPDALAIRRASGGLVRVEAGEVRHLAEVLTLHAGLNSQNDIGENHDKIGR